MSTNSYKIDPSSVRAAGPAVSGTLVNEQAPPGKPPLRWSLEALSGCQFARLQVDEVPEVGRYRINDILEAGALAQKADWTRQGGDAKGSSFSCGRMTADLMYQPFKLSVKIDGKPAVNLNSRGMFVLEQRRTKEVRGHQIFRACPLVERILSLSYPE